MIHYSILKQELTLLQKRSVFKIAVDIVKADNQIHKNELSLLSELQTSLDLQQEDLDMVHYASLQEALYSLKGLSDEAVSGILNLFEDIIRIDNDVDFNENLLYAAVKTVLRKESGAWSGVISVSGVDAETSSRQIVYLEESPTSSAHDVFDDEYDFLLISKALGDVGFQLFYLPDVIKGLEQRWGSYDNVCSKYDLLQQSMGYLVPAGDKDRINNLSDALNNLGNGAFYQVVLSRYNITPEQIASKSFLFLKIRDCYVLDDDDILRKAVDFLYLDMSKDVKKRILSFVSEFDVKVFQLSYEGYYKLLFDYLSFESKTLSHITIDRKWNFCLNDLEEEIIRFESSPQARSFYLLLLKYGSGGITQETFENAVSYLKCIPQDKYVTQDGFDILSFETDLLRNSSEATSLLYNIIKIYGAISTKDTEDRSFLKYILSILQHRSSIKNYINNGFSGTVRLANKEQYFVVFNPVTKSYCLHISPSLFYFNDGSGHTRELSDSSFWKSLI